KPAEELYDISEDPHNIMNLATDPSHQEVLQRMRKANRDWMIESQDLGFIPEGQINNLREGRSLYEAVRAKDVPIGEIIGTAELASFGSNEQLDELAKRLDHKNPSVRFWAAMGLAVAEEKAKSYEERLLKHMDDPSPAVRLAVAEALYVTGNSEKALYIIRKSLNHSDEFVKLRALNLLQVLNRENLSQSIRDQIQA